VQEAAFFISGLPGNAHDHSSLTDERR